MNYISLNIDFKLNLDSVLCLGYKVAIPKKTDKKAWDEIRKKSREMLYEYQEIEQKRELREKHEMEKEIVNLESREYNKERDRRIKNLKGLLKNS